MVSMPAAECAGQPGRHAILHSQEGPPSKVRLSVGTLSEPPRESERRKSLYTLPIFTSNKYGIHGRK